MTVCLRRRPPILRVMRVCLALGVFSEIIKFFSVTQIIPMVDPEIAVQSGTPSLQWVPTGEYTPYLAIVHLPLELCSLYLFSCFSR